MLTEQPTGPSSPHSRRNALKARSLLGGNCTSPKDPRSSNRTTATRYSLHALPLRPPPADPKRFQAQRAHSPPTCWGVPPSSSSTGVPDFPSTDAHSLTGSFPGMYSPAYLTRTGTRDTTTPSANLSGTSSSGSPSSVADHVSSVPITSLKMPRSRSTLRSNSAGSKGRATSVEVSPSMSSACSSVAFVISSLCMLLMLLSLVNLLVACYFVYPQISFTGTLSPLP